MRYIKRLQFSKASSFERLRKKLVLVMRSEFYEYVEREFHTNHLRPADDRDSVHVHVYNVVEMDREWHIVLDERKSTNVLGVASMLGLSERPEISESEVIRRIRAKMASAKELTIPA